VSVGLIPRDRRLQHYLWLEKAPELQQQVDFRTSVDSLDDADCPFHPDLGEDEDALVVLRRLRSARAPSDRSTRSVAQPSEIR
jgi:hypothetical protein